MKARLKVTESSPSTASQPSYYGLDILLTFWLHSSMRCTCLILFLWSGCPEDSFEVRIWTLFVDLRFPRMLSRFQKRKLPVLKRLIEGWNCRFVSTRRGNQVWNLFICAFSRKGYFLRKENQRRIDWIQLNSILKFEYSFWQKIRDRKLHSEMFFVATRNSPLELVKKSLLMCLGI